MFELKVITPKGVYLTHEVDSITVKSVDGQRTILPNHMALVLPLEIASFKTVSKSMGEQTYFNSEGVLTFEDNKALMMLAAVEKDTEIDLARAEAAKQRALERLKDYDESIDMVRAEASLKRAINRMRLKE